MIASLVVGLIMANTVHHDFLCDDGSWLPFTILDFLIVLGVVVVLCTVN